MNRSCTIRCWALGLLMASGCSGDTPEAESTCAPHCVSTAQTGDAGSVAPDASGNPGADAGDVPPSHAEAGAVIGFDAGPVAPDAGSVNDANAIGTFLEGGAWDASEAGAGGGDAGEPAPECQGPKTPSGERCAVDADCGAGLLCDAASRTCRAISGIELLSSFWPSGQTDAYSEGLDFAHGSLWQSTADTLWRIDVAARSVVASYPTPSEYGEGLTWRGSVLYNASYRDSFLYAAELRGDQLSFAVLGELQMTGGCAYGIVDHCDELYTTRCGRSVVDVYASGTTTPILRTFTVRDTGGTPLPQVEDLEIYRGQLWTSTFNSRAYDSTLFRVDMQTYQAVEAYEIPCATLAIDGVAADPATRTLYVTGKDCPIFVYRVQ